MIQRTRINFYRSNEWKLSINEIAIMAIVSDLNAYAHFVASYETNGGENYYAINRKEVLIHLPCIFYSVSTVSRALKKIEEKHIVKSMKIGRVKAYCITDKGSLWNEILPENNYVL